jgi:hypothetical protein
VIRDCTLLCVRRLAPHRESSFFKKGHSIDATLINYSRDRRQRGCELSRFANLLSFRVASSANIVTCVNYAQTYTRAGARIPRRITRSAKDRIRQRSAAHREKWLYVHVISGFISICYREILLIDKAETRCSLDRYPGALSIPSIRERLNRPPALHASNIPVFTRRASCCRLFPS